MIGASAQNRWLALAVALCAIGCGDEGADTPDIGDAEWADVDFADLGGELSEYDRSVIVGTVLAHMRWTPDEQWQFCECHGHDRRLPCLPMNDASPCFAAPQRLCFGYAIDALDDRELRFLDQLYRLRYEAAACADAWDGRGSCALNRACYDVAIPAVQAACAVAPPDVLAAFAACPMEW